MKRGLPGIAFLLCLLPCLASATDAAPAAGRGFTITHGVLQVPENRTRGSGVVQLAYVRAQRGATPSRSAHVLLAGGPGDSGVEQVVQLIQRGGPQVLGLFDGDIIGIDQRGSGRSLPQLGSTARYALPLDQPASIEGWLPRMREVARTVATDLRRQGIDLSAYSTGESADDVDAVRAALGYDTLTLWGRSYGSHLALATLRRHPARVARMVLIGPEGPDDTWKLPAQADEILQRLGQRAGQPDLPDRMRAVIAALEARPVVVDLTDPATGAPVSITLGALDLQWATAQALGDPRTLATLPAAYQRMAEGDFTAFAPIALALRSRAGVGSAMKHVMDLGSGASPARRRRIAEQARTAVLGNSLNFPGMYLDEAWGSPDPGADFRLPVSSSAPVLILVGDLDARTPVANGERIAAHMPNARLVVLENAAHQFNVFGEPRVLQVLGEFLREGRTGRQRVVLPSLRFAAAGQPGTP